MQGLDGKLAVWLQAKLLVLVKTGKTSKVPNHLALLNWSTLK